MTKTTIPADERVKVVTQEMLQDRALTIRAAETGPDVSVYTSATSEGRGFPLRADDEWTLSAGDDLGEWAKDGLWMETDSSQSTDVQVLKGVRIVRNVRRQQSASIDADTSGILKSSDQPLDVSDQTVSTTTDATDGGPYTDRTTTAGNTATVTPGRHGDPVSIVVDANGSGTLTVEVSQDGGNNWDAYTVAYDSSGVNEDVAGFGRVRASANQNLNALAIAAKGV